MVKRKIKNKAQILYEQKAFSPIVDPVIDPIIDIQDVHLQKPILEEKVKIDINNILSVSQISIDCKPTDVDICDYEVKEKAIVKRVVLNKFRLEKDNQLNITDQHANVNILYYYI
jgi:hypothetical protein